MIGSTLVASYGITLGIDKGTKLSSLVLYFGGSHYGKLEGVLLVTLLGFSDGPQQ